MPVLFQHSSIVKSTLTIASVFAVLCPGLSALSQDRLPKAPGYDAYRKFSQAASDARFSVMQSSVGASFTADGKGVILRRAGEQVRYDIETKATGKVKDSDVPASGDGGGRRRFRGGGGPARGRQAASVDSPDGTMKAIYRDRNLYIQKGDQDKNPAAVTTDGSAQTRIKYGTASWVYGEELEQRSAFWWSPDSKKLAYYRFDESKVIDFYTLNNVSAIQDGLDVEAYPKAGAPNPVADLYIYDLATKKAVKVDARDGKPANNDVPGYYVYNVRWSPDGKELLYNRTDRYQKTMEIAAANPETGTSRVLVHESNPAGYSENNPPITYVAGNKQFLLVSGRSGYKNFYLYDMAGKLVRPVTSLTADVADIVKLDEAGDRLYYMAHDGDNAMKLQLHVCSLSGKTPDARLTDPSLTHSVTLSADGKYFIDVAESHDHAPETWLVEAKPGAKPVVLGKADTTKVDALKVPAPELIICKAADGKTDLYGMLYKPAGFDPQKKYPLLVSVYGGPTVSVLSERYSGPNSETGLGFLVASFDNRGTPNRGRAFEQATYGKLGVVDIDDQAAGVKALIQRGYVDTARVGIYGTSYGGYASAMALLRHPEVYTAACAMSAVTDWHNYDTVYTERYMSTPQENASGYKEGSAMTYADQLKGRLMIYFGTADDNVHPNNAMQLITALQRARKSFDVQVGPDMGHTALNHDRMLEFFFDAFGMWGK
jgi:dipeptidyl-peptidase 4